MSPRALQVQSEIRTESSVLLRAYREDEEDETELLADLCFQDHASLLQRCRSSSLRGSNSEPQVLLCSCLIESLVAADVTLSPGLWSPGCTKGSKAITRDKTAVL